MDNRGSKPLPENFAGGSRPPGIPIDAAIQPLATLPLFFKLGGRRVLLVGGSDGAAWKAELLAAAGAKIVVIAAEPGERMRIIVAAAGASAALIERSWMPDDLKGAALAIADLETREDALAFQAAARASGVPVNLVDRPEFCDFQFGSIVNRSPLVVGISTDGAAPVFGQAVRARIETLLPAGFARWAQAARDWRPAVQARALPFRARRNFWESFTALALSRPNDAPSQDDQRNLLSRADDSVPAQTTGRVLLVGAGPGDPELLTLRAARALQSADVVMFDDLVSPGVLDMARREAERVNVGKRGYKPSCGQDEISAMLVRFASEGKVVVRLKGGDPLIFGRANEEIDALRAANISVEIIPGVTAASSAAAALTRSLTERDLARRLQFVTGHARDGKLPSDLDWQALADSHATTVIYMGVRTLPHYVERVMAAGLDPSTPAVLVERASWPDQRVSAATLATIVEAAKAHAPSGPCLVLIGSALAGTQSNATS